MLDVTRGANGICVTLDGARWTDTTRWVFVVDVTRGGRVTKGVGLKGEVVTRGHRN